jgi:hypothetical protein
MRRILLLACVFPALLLASGAAAEGVKPVVPGLYALTTEIETEAADPGSGTLLDTWMEPYSGGACLQGEADLRIRPETFADGRCSFSAVRPDPYGEAFDVICVFPEGLMSGAGTLAVDPARPTEFREAFTLRGEGLIATQRVTIKGRRIGECPATDDLLP